ncbi:MAG: hypothetical protein R6V03_04860 [Kiritimatiellia bacterium]
MSLIQEALKRQQSDEHGEKPGETTPPVQEPSSLPPPPPPAPENQSQEGSAPPPPPPSASEGNASAPERPETAPPADNHVEEQTPQTSPSKTARPGKSFPLPSIAGLIIAGVLILGVLAWGGMWLYEQFARPGPPPPGKKAPGKKPEKPPSAPVKPRTEPPPPAVEISGVISESDPEFQDDLTNTDGDVPSDGDSGGEESEPEVTVVEPEPEKPPVVWPALSLGGIVGRGKDGAVIINGQIVGVGDIVNGVRIAAILRNSVKLEHGGETRILKVGHSTDY